jgi:stearoyl-CoA desaturase (delta-9 desaturase)
MLMMHSAALLGAVFCFSWLGLAAAVVLYYISGMFGITIGFHRLLTHRSFKAPLWLQRVLATCGTLALQGGPMQWVARHRMHHAGVDTSDDPHDARQGFWHCHLGWILLDRAQFDSDERHRKFARDIARDPYMNWLSTGFGQLAVQVALQVAIWATLGFEVFVYTFFVRTVALYHATWTVNSLAHMFGYQNFATGDHSRNNWFVALIAFGEGWHNNHHAHQDVCPNGKRWFEFDLSWQMVKLFRLLGLAWDVKEWRHVPSA